jgi:hypothetical protein
MIWQVKRIMASGFKDDKICLTLMAGPRILPAERQTLLHYKFMGN